MQTCITENLHASEHLKFMPQQQIYGLYIVSSADGLLYDALFGACVNHSPSENTRIQLASSFASMSHIAKELSPVKNCTGITTLEADTFTVEVRYWIWCYPFLKCSSVLSFTNIPISINFFDTYGTKSISHHL